MSRSNRRSPLSRRVAAGIVAAALIALGVGLAACGGDEGATDSTASIPTGELSATALATEADSLCTETSDAIAARSDVPDFGANGLQADELKESAPFFEASAAEQQDLFDELSELQPSDDVAADWKKFLSAYQTGGVDFANDLAEQAAAGNPQDFFDTALKSQSALNDLAAAAAALGLKSCGARNTAPAGPGG